MAENKTKTTRASVQAFIKGLPEPRRSDAKAMVRIMQSVPHEKPKMWGAPRSSALEATTTATIVAGDNPLTYFSPRNSATVLYNMGSADKALLKRLGKHVPREITKYAQFKMLRFGALWRRISFSSVLNPARVQV